MNKAKKISAALGIFGVILCSACCALPLLGIVGLGALSIPSKYFEWVGIATIVLAALLFGITIIKKSRNLSKKEDCGC